MDDGATRGPLDLAVVIDLPKVPAERLPAGALVQAGWSAARRRFKDLQIASIAVANGRPLPTRSPPDFSGLESILTVIGV